MQENTIVKEDSEVKIKEPRLYNVIILNDDYTPMEFVVNILVEIFHKKVPEATKIMYEVHYNGKGIAGKYPRDIALTKAAQVHSEAESNNYPLKASVKEE